MTKQLALYLTAIAVCFFLGVFPAGLAFAAACLFVGFPRGPIFRWYFIIIAALISDIAAFVLGDNSAVFWTLLVTAAMVLALESVPRAAALTAIGWLLLRFEAAPAIYIAMFVGVIWNTILLFTKEKNYAIINKEYLIERNAEQWRENPTTTKA